MYCSPHLSYHIYIAYRVRVPDTSYRYRVRTVYVTEHGYPTPGNFRRGDTEFRGNTHFRWKVALRCFPCKAPKQNSDQLQLYTEESEVMLRLIQFEMANRSHLPCASSTGSLSTTRLRLQLSPNTKNSVRGNVGTRTPSVITASKFHVELVRKGSVGKSVVVGESVTLVGSAVDSGLKLSVEGVGEKHAALRKGNGRLFCTALLGEGDMMADTSTWVRKINTCYHAYPYPPLSLELSVPVLV